MIEIRNETGKPIYIKIVHTKLTGTNYIYVDNKPSKGYELCDKYYYLQPEVEEFLA